MPSELRDYIAFTTMTSELAVFEPSLTVNVLNLNTKNDSQGFRLLEFIHYSHSGCYSFKAEDILNLIEAKSNVYNCSNQYFYFKKWIQ